jgi:hypothetical protein
MSIRTKGCFAAAAMALAALGQPAGAQSPGPSSGTSAAAVTAETFRGEIARLYPSDFKQQKKLGGAEKIAGRLDAFWTKVKADKATYLPLLRAELVRPGNPSFFYWDGAELLRSASDSREDGQLALDSISRADLEMVNLDGYLYALSWFVNHGYDTRRAALRWLDKPREQIIVQPLPHTFYYTPLEATIFSLFGMDERLFVRDLIARLQNAADDYEITYLIDCIWATATPEGRAALTAYADDQTHKEKPRAFARQMLDQKGDGPMPTETEAELRQARRDVIANPFRHGSLEEFRGLTDKLVRIAP